MTKEVKQTIKLTREKREKKTYDGTPIPEGYVLAPIWLKQDFVNEASYIKSENLTTREYGDITFLIGYVAVPPEKYEGLKRDCDEQINAYLKKQCAGRCIIGKKKDGSPKLCPKNNSVLMEPELLAKLTMMPIDCTTASTIVRYLVYCEIFFLPSSPCLESCSKAGMPTLKSCMIIDALI